LKSRGIKGTVHLNIYEREEVLYIEVRDNGIGVAKAKEKKSLHKSYGLDNLKGRIEQLSIIQGKEITFDLTDIKNDEGVQEWTVATITMAI
jgi:sensor histidine kinase YesM